MPDDEELFRKDIVRLAEKYGISKNSGGTQHRVWKPLTEQAHRATQRNFARCTPES
jgi:hypothetical protein